MVVSGIERVRLEEEEEEEEEGKGDVFEDVSFEMRLGRRRGPKDGGDGPDRGIRVDVMDGWLETSDFSMDVLSFFDGGKMEASPNSDDDDDGDDWDDRVFDLGRVISEVEEGTVEMRVVVLIESLLLTKAERGRLVPLDDDRGGGGGPEERVG